MYRIFMYRTSRGDRPVEEYLNQLEEKHRAKIAARLQLLAHEGPNLRRPYADTEAKGNASSTLFVAQG